MRVTKQRIEAAKQQITIDVVRYLCSKHNISTEAALRMFIATKTYALLQIDSARLWIETHEYVINMLECEFNNDVEGWLSI